jgi:hypothetical protein
MVLAALRVVNHLRVVDGRDSMMLVRYLQLPMLCSRETFAHVVPTQSYSIPPNDDGDKSFSCEASQIRRKITAFRP